MAPFDMSSNQLILASASPRRRELLDGLGLRFDVIAVDIPELDADSAPHLSPTDLARENARRKAAVAAERSPGCWVLEMCIRDRSTPCSSAPTKKP